MGLDQQGLELGPPPGVAADRKRAQRVAVIALAPRDDMAALRLTDLDKILARHLERRLDRLRTAADQIDVAQPGGASSIRRSARRSATSVVKKDVCA